MRSDDFLSDELHFKRLCLRNIQGYVKLTISHLVEGIKAAKLPTHPALLFSFYLDQRPVRLTSITASLYTHSFRALTFSFSMPSLDTHAESIFEDLRRQRHADIDKAVSR